MVRRKSRRRIARRSLRVAAYTCVVIYCGIAAAGEAPSRAESGPAAPATEPLFARHVVAVLDRLGCNSGACHGSFRGQNGFRLSLFGGDPAMDYEFIARDAFGRRLNRVAPERSLLLLKPSLQVPHRGGLRLPKD